MAHLPVSESSPYKVDLDRYNTLYKTGNIAESRDIFVDHIGSVPQVTIAEFLEHLMPPQKLSPPQFVEVSRMLCGRWRVYGGVDNAVIHDKNVRATRWKTRRAPYDKKRKAWSDYVKPPRQRSQNEKAVYAPLSDICDQVTACSLAVRGDLTPTTRLLGNGSTPLIGSKYNSAPNDAFHYLMGDHDDELDIYDCVVNVQQKKSASASDTQDNDKKVIWDQHQIMRMDPRRRFTFGMTFADTTIRLWHYNREVLVVSEAFDLNEDYEVLIDVYARLSFATMPELGFDMTMTLLRSPSAETAQGEEQHQFRIAVGGVHYIATHILGRLLEGESVDKTYAIKDCWVEATRDTEFKVLQHIKTAILAYDWDNQCHPPLKDGTPALVSYESDRVIDPRHGQLTREERLRYFVDIIDGVKVQVDGHEDNTQEVIANKYQFPHERDMYRVDSSSVMESSTGSTRISIWRGTVGNEADLAKPREVVGRFFRPIVPRTHHRLVMEQGVPLSKVENASAAFSVVTDAAYALFMLHCIAWLHRDISADNILQMPDGRGVLADLEYTKMASDPRTRSFRTGTPDFLAIEVAKREYLSIGKRRRANPFDAASQAVAIDKTPWRFRDVHDLESIWWLCLWLLFHHTTERRPACYDLVAQAEKCGQLFPGFLYLSKARSSLLTQPDRLEEALATLPGDWTTTLGPYLGIVRDQLCEAYDLDKRGRPLHPGTWWMICEMCSKGQAINGKLVWITKEEVDQAKKLRKAQLEASQRNVGTAHSDQKQTGPEGSAVAVMAASPVREDQRRSTGKRKTCDDEESVHYSSSSSEDGSPRKRAKRGKPSKGNNEPRSSDKDESRPSRRDPSHSSGRNASRSGGKHAARRDGTRG